MKFLTFLTLLVLIFCGGAGARSVHGIGGSGATVYTIMTPSSTWASTGAGALWSGYSGTSQAAVPGGPTMPILDVQEDTGGNSAIQLSVASTAGMTGTYVCVKYVNGAGVSAANGCWTYTTIAAGSCASSLTAYPCIELTGSTWSAGTFSISSSPYAKVGNAFGAQGITAMWQNSDATSSSFAPVCLQVASTALYSNGDTYTIFSAGGAGKVNGSWNIWLTSTGANGGPGVCLGTSFNPGPPWTWASGYTSGGIIAYDEPVIASMDEHSGVVIEASNTEYVTIGAAIGNRGWISGVQCYYEGTTPTTILTQQASPRGTDGYVVGLNPPATGTYQAGDANFTCDVIPTQGLARRLSINTWLNVPSTGHYANRGVGYVSSSTGADIPGSSAGYICTDSTGKVVSFYSNSSCTTPLTVSISYVAAIFVCSGGCGSSDTIQNVTPPGGGPIYSAQSKPDQTVISPNNQATGCIGVTQCTMQQSVGANLNGAQFSTSQSCSSTTSYVYATVRSAIGCAQGGPSASLGNGYIIYVNNGDTLTEVGVNTGIGGITGKLNKHMIEVRPCNGTFPSSCGGAPSKITAVQSYSGTTVTLAVSNIPSSWTTGTTVLVSGEFPLEYDGEFTLTGVTGAGGNGTISFACCLGPLQTALTNPALVHPDAMPIYGQVVVPYSLTLPSKHQGITMNASNLEWEGAVFDTSKYQSIAGCTGGSCAANINLNYCATATYACPLPRTQGTIINNSALIDPNNQGAGPTYGYQQTDGADICCLEVYAIFGNSNTAFSALEETSTATMSTDGAELYRNVGGFVSWSLMALAQGQPTNIGFFNTNLSNPASQAANNLFPAAGMTAGLLSRVTYEPLDGVSTTPCASDGSSQPNCMPSVYDTPTYNSTSYTNCPAGPYTCFHINSTSMSQEAAGGFGTMRLVSGKCAPSSSTVQDQVGNLEEYNPTKDTSYHVGGQQYLMVLYGDYVNGCGSSSMIGTIASTGGTNGAITVTNNFVGSPQIGDLVSATGYTGANVTVTGITGSPPTSIAISCPSTCPTASFGKVVTSTPAATLGCGATCIVINDTTFSYDWAHQDYLQFTGTTATQPFVDWNLFSERENDFLFGFPIIAEQGVLSGSTPITTGNLTSSGQTVTVACATGNTSVVPSPDQFIQIASGNDIFQYRKIVSVVPGWASGCGSFTVDKAFDPDITTAAPWQMIVHYGNVAFVGAHISGNSIADNYYSPLGGKGNRGTQAQIQNGCTHCIWVQETVAYNSFIFMNNQTITEKGFGQGPGYGMSDVSIYDTIIAAGCVQTTGVLCTNLNGPPAINSVNSDTNSGTSPSNAAAWVVTNSHGSGVPSMGGSYAFDTNLWTLAASGYAPGTNITSSQSLFVNDYNNRPCTSTSGQGCANYVSPNTPPPANGIRGAATGNGLPLFPFTADGVPKGVGSYVGAMQP